MSVTGAFIVPHPPIILPEIGCGEEKRIGKTADSYRETARRVAALRPDTIVLTSPHSIMYSDYFHISPGRSAKGDFSKFRAYDVSMKVDYDINFVSELEQTANIAGISAGTMGEKNPALDHGTMIPLRFINEVYTGYKLVRIGLSGLPFADHYRLGMCIADVSDKLKKNVVFIASGDLSHKVLDSGPYGFAPEGVEFDSEITEAMASGDFMRFLTFEPDFIEKAAECGLRSFIIMAGALDGKNVDAELLSYEGTFGVGYGVASFIPKEDNPDRRFLDGYNKLKKKKMRDIKDSEDYYVTLARYSVEHYVRTGTYAEVPDGLPKDLTEKRAGVFVSLKENGALRGCIGTIAPMAASIAEEIIRNAVSACSDDPRFNQVRPDELSRLVYSVDILSQPEPVDSPTALDPKRYGVIVSCGSKRGLLLPDLEGVDTAAQQIDIARRKAGIEEDERIKLQRFEVVRHK